MTLPFSVEELQKAVAEGDVTARPHPTLPLHIYNYSPAVQFEKKWNDVTLNCRGLVLDAEYNVVARPWKKFFNLGEVELGFQFTDPVEVMDKADGSLGILYTYEGYVGIATRGSFSSKQAEFATALWNERYAERYNQEVVGGGDYTYLFEIIYPSNRIVLDYGDMEDLILLGCTFTGAGYYHSPRAAASYLDWDGPVVETYNFANISEAIGSMGRKNKEGYVVRRNNFLVKIKEPDYLDLHRLVTNCSPKTVWEQLKDGKSVTEICSNFPDEFHGMVKGFAEPLMAKYDARLMTILEGYEVHASTVTRAYEGAPTYPDRAAFARQFKKDKDARYYFLLLDERPVSDVLWQELKPKEAK